MTRIIALAAAAALFAPAALAQGDEDFGNIDRDGDRMLSLEELTETFDEDIAEDIIAAFDRDNDQNLVPSELRAGRVETDGMAGDTETGSDDM